MNCCKLVIRDTKEYGMMLRRILIFEEGKVPAKDAKGWQIEGQKRRVTRKEYKRSRQKFDVVNVEKRGRERGEKSEP